MYNMQPKYINITRLLRPQLLTAPASSASSQRRYLSTALHTTDRHILSPVKPPSIHPLVHSSCSSSFPLARPKRDPEGPEKPQRPHQSISTLQLQDQDQDHHAHRSSRTGPNRLTN